MPTFRYSRSSKACSMPFREGSDHNLLSLEAPLSLEPIDQSNDRWVVTHRRQSRHVQGDAEHGIANFGDPHGPVDRDSRLVLLRIQARVGSDRGAGAEDIGTRQFGQHDASQGFSHAVDADQ
jgi:hypothetical protein